MFRHLQESLRRWSFRRALRAIGRDAPGYMGELLRNRLLAGLATPAEVLAALGSWKAAHK